MLFAAAAAAAAWGAWLKSPVSLSPGAANQGDVIITLALLAGLPLLTRRLLGPPGSGAARWFRAGSYAVILAIMAAKAVPELFIGAVPRGGINLRTFYFITACYLAVILALTARRAGVAPVTLAVSAGLAFYAVICVAFPVIGAVMGLFGAGLASAARPLTDGGRPPGTEPVPGQPEMPSGPYGMFSRSAPFPARESSSSRT